MALTTTSANNGLTILALDSSSMTGSVALWRDGVLLAESLLNLRTTHSERLLVQVEQLLAATGLALVDLDLLGVVHGPGSFTGLRVGLATAKGLATAADLPVVGLSTLEVLAMNLPFAPYPVCAFLDARKQEVYSCLYDCSSGFPVAVGTETVQPPRQLLNNLADEVVLVGDGVPLYHGLIDEILAGRAKLPPAVAHQPRAAAAAVLAAVKFDTGLALPVSKLKPCYIRPSDADLPKSRGGSAVV
ncbi:MAG: tRNA (adenosine(37)-N6)-threonylcarbamoyltransferase complex dimerization subunit type 1 TsaB [Desulfuromonas sp.]|jgi:tRNA threonylcarbamoyladenosine biosynthesis protein TsaB|nr:MAG: tRNA (adenosine(37)-N6)-threonylcarbamoyltransferase complex dimerization subunit type 1 TsaB [Desulfuromonas sp.]